MTPGWVENLSDGPKIVHGPVFYINLEFETCGAGIWEKKLNLGPSNKYNQGYTQYPNLSNISFSPRL